VAYPVYYVPSGDVLPVFFGTYDGGTGASITLTGLAVTDIEIYKDGGVTQRASDAGYTLLDTDGIDFDTITGIHGFSIDTGDNTDAGFYTVGAWFHVVVSAVTVDAQTVNFIACAFRLMAAEGVAGVPDVNVTHVGDTAQTAGDIMADTNDIQTRIPAALVGGRIDASVGAMAANVMTAAAAAADLSAELADAVWDEDIVAAHGTADTAGLFLKDVEAAVDTEIAAILEDTGTTLDDLIDTEIAAIKAKTDSLTFTVASVLDANVLRVNGDATAAARLEAVMDSVVTGAVNAGVPTTTSFVADGFTEATNDHFNGRLLTWTSGALVGQQTDITDYVGATQTFTVTVMTEAPADNDTFVIT
jgi:hypothetical protein